MKVFHNFEPVANIILIQVPSLSHWQMDVTPFYTCCLWQDSETSEDCEIFRFERRASQDCVGYQPPGAGIKPLMRLA